MIALKIDDIKIFTSKLFIQETFDHFYLWEAEIVTFNTFRMNGHIQKGFFSKEELEENTIRDLSLWKTIKPICFSLIKGNKLPLSFALVLRLSEDNVDKLLKQSALSDTIETINGLFLNIKYESGILTCITGTSLQVFTMNKELEHTWDQMMKHFLKHHEIGFEEI